MDKNDRIDRLLIALLFLTPCVIAAEMRFSAVGWILIFLGIPILSFAAFHIVLTATFILKMDLDNITNYLLLIMATISFCSGYVFQIDSDGSNSLTVLQHAFIPKGNVIADKLSIYAAGIVCYSIPAIIIADGIIFKKLKDAQVFQQK